MKREFTMHRMFCAVLMWTLAIAVVSPALAKDKTIRYRTGDPQMAAAIKKAHATIATFWAAKTSPSAGVSGFALKVAVTEPNNEHTEHFWLINIRKEADGKLSGEINNDPNHIKSVKLGQRYVFPPEKISDWMFLRKGKIVGAWTLRVMIKRMPRRQADYFRNRLEKK